MELFLNLVWLVIATAATAPILLRNQRDGGDQRLRWVHLGILLCGTALLFPSISASDDIHYEAFIVEDSTSAKRLNPAHSSTNPAAPVLWFPALLLLGFAGLFERRWRLIESRSVCYRVPFFSRNLLGRAPPATPATER